MPLLGLSLLCLVSALSFWASLLLCLLTAPPLPETKSRVENFFFQFYMSRAWDGVVS